MNEYEDYLEHGFFQNAVNGVRKAWGTATHNAPKYIKKIGNRYFYTQQELNAYLHKGMGRLQKGAEYLAQRGISAAKKDLHTLYNSSPHQMVNAAEKGLHSAYNTGRRNLSNAANTIERNAVGAYNKGRRAVNNGISNIEREGTRIKNNTSRALNDLYTRSPEQNINALNRKLKKRRR